MIEAERELVEFVNKHAEAAKTDDNLAFVLDHIVFAIHMAAWRRGEATAASLSRNLQYRRPWHEPPAN